MVVVLWHDVGRLCRFFFWSVLPRAVRWRAAREVPSVVVAVFVVNSFCVSFICLLLVAGLVVVFAQSDV